jgi:hypothetical protein
MKYESPNYCFYSRNIHSHQLLVCHSTKILPICLLICLHYFNFNSSYMGSYFMHILPFASLAQQHSLRPAGVYFYSLRTPGVGFVLTNGVSMSTLGHRSLETSVSDMRQISSYRTTRLRSMSIFNFATYCQTILLKDCTLNTYKLNQGNKHCWPIWRKDFKSVSKM